jgi:hypothetical protein
MLLLANPRHDVGGGALVAEFVGHESHVGVDVFEEELVACAEVIQSGLAVGGQDEAMLGALAVAGKAHVALTAIARQGVAFVEAKAVLLGGIHQCLERLLHDVA